MAWTPQTAAKIISRLGERIRGIRALFNVKIHTKDAGPDRSTFAVKGSAQEDPVTRRYFTKGKCDWGDQCQFVHQTGAVDIFDQSKMSDYTEEPRGPNPTEDSVNQAEKYKRKIQITPPTTDTSKKQKWKKIKSKGQQPTYWQGPETKNSKAY